MIDSSDDVEDMAVPDGEVQKLSGRGLGGVVSERANPASVLTSLPVGRN
jgi:hypothetical protein